MKKINLLLIITVLTTFSFFISCDKDDDIKNPTILNEALVTKYPGVSNVEWDREGSFYVADCYVKGVETEVWFTLDVNWVKSEFDLTYDMLPSYILETITNLGYGRVNIDDIDLIYEIDKDEYYRIEIDKKGKDLLYYISKTGELLPATP